MSPARMRVAWLLGWWAGTRALAWAAMVAGTFAARPLERYPFWMGQTEGGLWWQHVPNRVFDVWGRWDSIYYLEIARVGYPTALPDGGWVFHGAFFPLFPALVRGASELFFQAPHFYVGLWLANASLLLAAVYLERLVRLDGSEAHARWAVVALFSYPGSHFLSAVYPESTALLLGVLALYLARTARPWAAFLAAALAVVARPTGFLVTLAVLAELWLQRKEPGARKSALAGAVLPLGAALLFLGLHQQTWGDPLYFLHVQAAWGRSTTLPLTPLFDLSLTLDHQLFWGLGLLALVLGVRQRARPSSLWYAGALLVFPLFFGSLRSVHRFLAGDFPLYGFAARALLERRRLALALLVGSLAVLCVFSYRWGAGAWPN